MFHNGIDGYGTSPQGKGVFGYATGDSGGGLGVEGRSNSPGDVAFIAVRSLTEPKVSAKVSPNRASDTLALAASDPGHAALAPEGSKGLYIGPAMESLERGSGLIWVMVDLRRGP